MELLERDYEFTILIDQAVLILSERKADDNYKVFQDRYGKNGTWEISNEQRRNFVFG